MGHGPWPLRDGAHFGFANLCFGRVGQARRTGQAFQERHLTSNVEFRPMLDSF